MYFRISTKKENGKISRFVQLARSIRVGKTIRTEIIAHLGPYEEFIEKAAPSLLRRLSQMTGQCLEEAVFEEGQDVGNVILLLLLWEKLGMEEVFEAQPKGRVGFDVVKYIRCLVINRLCDPTSKLGIGQWLKGTYFPGISSEDFIYHQALRSMDWLIERKEGIERGIAEKFLTLFDQKLQILFYDVTSSYFTSDRSIDGDDPEEIMDHGYSRDHRSDCYQITIGLVMTMEGLPLCHYVFPGNRQDRSTVCGVVEDVRRRFGVKDVVLVGDRGMLSADNIDKITEEELRFILSHPLRGDNAVCHVIEKRLASLKRMAEHADEELYDEMVYRGRRFVISYNKKRARRDREKRQRAIEKAQSFIDERLRNLRRSMDGRMRKGRGRPLTSEGAYNAIHDYLRDRKILRLFDLRLKGKGLVVNPNQKNLKWEEKIDGVLVLETTDQSLSPSEVVKQYKNLQDLERCFRTLKSSLELRPMYHWTPDRIRAHVFICVIALQLSRLMRRRLSGSSWSWEKAIERLRGIKTFIIKTGATKRRGITVGDKEQKAICKQLGLPFPQYKHLASLEQM